MGGKCAECEEKTCLSTASGHECKDELENND